MHPEYNASLKDYNTFGIDATCKVMHRFSSATDLIAVLKNGEFKSLPRLILGGGSNVLLSGDFEGLVLKNEIKGVELIDTTESEYIVKVGAGENWHQFVLRCIDEGWAGLENLSLIPGNVGASPMQNIGAYGVEIKDRFQELEALNLETLEIETFRADDCAFGYRESIFKRAYKDRYIILSVTFRLLKEPKLNTSYGDIENELERMKVSPSIKSVSDAVIRIRQSKLPNPAELGNAGSFFKNPIVSQKAWSEISVKHPEIPNYPAGTEKVKLAAGWLIEHAGWKGKRMGNCGMHEKQALVLVNYGGATGREIMEHAERVQKSVFEKFGVELEREVNLI
ncbi:MAG: UDP-N-acetylmuramate dehydrogenase [Cryomorphaceae bacterium]|nr:UDP-N-acetylmuramate dehydrogenase [Flavobacteriales bacterium]